MKDKLVSFFLCLFFGTLGIHRFYLRKKKTAFLMLITLGGCGLWYLADLVAILRGRLQRKEKKAPSSV
ncbi:MAG: TM2 domain-containing protein [Rhabdochlamydiaceae bacterium]|nr:TM2 domain-containing protein [Rhabdochlamydiaceae bacterium]